MGQNYKAIINLFSDASFYPHPVEHISHFQTHVSHVFLTGNFVYKLKKPVDFGFLDFSTLEKRIHFCREELRLNRRLAPDIYLGVWAVCRDPESPLGHSLKPLEEMEPEQILEPALCMAQMDVARMMDALLELGGVGEEEVIALARLLARFYTRAGRGAKVDFFGRWEQVRINVEENFRQTEEHQEVSVDPARWRAVRDYSLGFLNANRELFGQRVGSGRIVDGHGDLHSGNINLPPGREPLVFDCIEFNDRFRYQDQACDLAFLAMDLDFHSRPDLSDLLAGEFAAASGDVGLFQVLDFYKCYRAVVRAKIHGLAFDEEGASREHRFTDLDKARAYFRLAASYAGGGPPFFLLCVMGLMGTGKSYLARHFSAETGWPLLQSDRVRKQAAGLAPGQKSHDQWGQGLYSPDKSRATYESLWQGAKARLDQGGSVVLDASFSRDEWRHKFLALAEACGAVPLFVEVRASEPVVRERLARREQEGASLSDGRLAIQKDQAAAWQEAAWLAGRGSYLLVDGGQPLESKLKLLFARLRDLGLRQ